MYLCPLGLHHLSSNHNIFLLRSVFLPPPCLPISKTTSILCFYHLLPLLLPSPFSTIHYPSFCLPLLLPFTTSPSASPSLLTPHNFSKILIHFCICYVHVCFSIDVIWQMIWQVTKRTKNKKGGKKMYYKYPFTRIFTLLASEQKLWWVMSYPFTKSCFQVFYEGCKRSI